ncbi:MAG: dethiobiotin synthase, partial [Methylovirgula sp.]
MAAVFITATGTEIGKTFVAAGLIEVLRRRGRNVAALKPVISGFDPQASGESDPAVLLR